jgi:RNA polymerase primary sigma factor
MKYLRYKSYVGNIDYCKERNILIGKVQGLQDPVISYEGNTIDELRRYFEDAIDDYLKNCKEFEKNPVIVEPEKLEAILASEGNESFYLEDNAEGEYLKALLGNVDGNEKSKICSYIESVEGFLSGYQLWDIDQISFDIYRTDLRKIKRLTSEEERELWERLYEGNIESRNQLIINYLSFVVHEVRRYKRHGVNYNDFICEGNLALIKAINKYDRGRGFSLQALAHYYIKNAVIQMSDEYGKCIRYPGNIATLGRRIKKISDCYLMENGMLPSMYELSDILDEDLFQIIVGYEFLQSTISLDFLSEYINDFDTTDKLISVLGKFDFPDNSHCQLDNLEIESLTIEIERVMCDVLSKKEMEILKLWFGLNGKKWKLEEIAERYELSRERVRQIRENAIKKIKKSKEVNILRKYLCM